ncbi:20S proteasome alpha/beta subunit [Neorhizobium sp. 2083]|uniref:hypothetical protein n=1 Tax=Neorhizobium sp. 2083 TaxID=2817762 RepID=UPI00285FFB81|nr:hypothetical protein [Neorhizobium sp. 2083]MDR6818493.1 20S proteasome alpha/beta subunit [Neorhizobium sp. 2083]
MTTIAIRDGVMAADTRAMVNGWKQLHSVQKIFRARDGSICAVTGDLARGTKAIENLIEGLPVPDLGDETRLIHLTKGGLFIYEGSGRFEIDCEFTAFGSGAIAAQAAMVMGADARKAVETAAMFDESTGGDIMVMELER